MILADNRSGGRLWLNATRSTTTTTTLHNDGIISIIIKADIVVRINSGVILHVLCDIMHCISDVQKLALCLTKVSQLF